MPANVVDQIIRELQSAAGLYYRLVLVATSLDDGCSVTLREVAQRTGAPLVNLSLELSRLLLDLPRKHRPMRVHRILEEVVGRREGDAVLLDHLELLFDPALAQDPRRLLRQLSRTKTIAVAWPGRIEAGYLVHAEPGHPEYRRYAVEDLRLVVLEV